MKTYKKINLIDYNIDYCDTWKQGCIMCSCRVPKDKLDRYYIPPKNTWVKKYKCFYENDVNSGISIFTDSAFDEYSKYESDYKIAMVLECPIEARGAYERVKNLKDKFSFIFTYKKDLIDQEPEKYKFMPCFVTIEDSAHAIHDKNKMISMIYSSKRDHERDMRHIVANLFENKIDLYGEGSKAGSIALKSDTLKNYMFSIVIENSNFDYYFTEKILDCFITGNVPIYRGTSAISKFFDARGFFVWHDIKDLENIIDNISFETYHDMLPYIKINYELAKKYVSPDDVMSELINDAISENNLDTLSKFLYINGDSFNHEK